MLPKRLKDRQKEILIFKKRRIFFIALAFITVTINCSVFHAIGLLNNGTYAINDSGKTGGIHFKPIANLIILPISFEKDATQYNFILDTGAGVTVIDSAVCDSMKLSSQAEVMSGGGFGVAKKEKFVVLPGFAFDRFYLNNIAAVSINLAVLSHATGMKISGIIGTNVLRHFQVFISYRDSLLAFSDPAFNVRQAAFSLPIKYSLSTSFLPLVSCGVSMGNKRTITADFVIDNGLNGWAMLPASYVRRLKIPQGEITGSYGETGHDAYKGKNVSFVRIAAINVGKIALKGVPAFVFTTNFKYPLIGKNVLEHFDFLLDYPAHRISFFIIPDSAGSSFFSHPYGTGLVTDKTSKGEVVIKGIWKDSPADKSCVKLTDKIVSIEGFALDSMSALSINGILNEGLSADMVKLVLEKADGNRQALSIGKSVFVGNK